MIIGVIFVDIDLNLFFINKQLQKTKETNMSETSSAYEVVVTTDIIRGGNNLGGSDSYKFAERSDMISFLQEIFKGKVPFFVNGMAVHESPQITVTASIYLKQFQLDASSLVS